MRFCGLLSQLEPRNVLLAGDINLDTYTVGEVSRISPEAPVPIVRVRERYTLPGCAGNAACGMAALGLRVRILGRRGDDANGVELVQLLEQAEACTKALFVEDGYATPVKDRVMASSSNQQLLRVDYERVCALSEELEARIIDELPELLEGVDVVAISDYGKGFLTDSLLDALIAQARSRTIPVVVDPKGRDFSRYRGATLVKPNLKEAHEASGFEEGVSLEKIANELLRKCQFDRLLITRSSQGATLFDTDGERRDFSVQIREVRDVTGAGDTVLSVIACGLANGLSLEETVHLSMLAAGIAVEHSGCAAISLPDLARRLMEENPLNKLFGEEHLFVLRHVLEGLDYAVLVVSSGDGFSVQLLTTVHRLAQKHDRLLLYVEESDPPAEYLELLASLRDVSYILVHAENVEQLWQMKPAKALYRIAGQEMVALRDLRELLSCTMGS